MEVEQRSTFLTILIMCFYSPMSTLNRTCMSRNILRRKLCKDDKKGKDRKDTLSNRHSPRPDVTQIGGVVVVGVSPCPRRWSRFVVRTGTGSYHQWQGTTSLRMLPAFVTTSTLSPCCIQLLLIFFFRCDKVNWTKRPIPEGPDGQLSVE